MQNHPQHTFTSEQKTGFVLLLAFGVLTVILGGLQLRNTIYKPFVIKAAADGTKQEQLNALLDDATRLQRIDTDKDGLNDYEELNFYQTSPYIPDTDSDGYTDKEEIDAGEDPLCPRGQACAEVETEVKKEQVDPASELFADAPTTGDIIGGGGGVPADSALGEVDGINELLGDPAKLRSALLGTGQVTESELAQFTDQDLLQAFTGSVERSETAAQPTEQ